MAVPVIMPRQGQSVESCIITEWCKAVGDRVSEGDILFTYETDKAVFEAPAKASGTLLAVFFEADDDVPCLTNVAVIGAPGEDFAQFTPAGKSPASAQAAPEQKADATPQAHTAPVAVCVQPVGEAAFVSPRAREAAARMNIDAAAAQGTGPHGRVIERDVIALIKEGRAGSGLGGRLMPGDVAKAAETSPSPPVSGAADYEDKKLPNIRKVIARSMQKSLSELAQLTHSSSFDATAIMDLRAQLKAAREKDPNVPNITLNDIIIFAASRVLLKHPGLNAHFLGESMRYFSHVHLGMAVDTPRGLLVPTLFNADKKSLREISSEAKALAKSAQDGSINPDFLAGATFTISNLGALGVEHFTPIINPPQTGILGVNCIVERVRSNNGAISVYPAMGLSLTYDHRALDGAPASRFLMDMRAALENFGAMLID